MGRHTYVADGPGVNRTFTISRDGVTVAQFSSIDPHAYQQVAEVCAALDRVETHRLGDGVGVPITVDVDRYDPTGQTGPEQPYMLHSNWIAAEAPGVVARLDHSAGLGGSELRLTVEHAGDRLVEHVNLAGRLPEWIDRLVAELADRNGST